MTHRLSAALFLAGFLACSSAAAQVTPTGGGVNVNFVDTDLRAAVQMLSPYLDRPVVLGNVGNERVTFLSPRPFPPGDIAGLLRELLAARGHELIAEGSIYRVQQKAAAPPPQASGQPQPVGPQFGAGGAPNVMQLNVIRLRHARAADVAATINALFGRGGALGELGDRRTSTFSEQMRENRIPPAGQPGAPAAPSGERDASLTGTLMMTPDERTNSLLVRANAADFELIQQAVTQIDVRPLQVLIEVVIAEVRRTSRFRLGLSSLLDTVRINGTNASVAGGTTGSSVQRRRGEESALSVAVTATPTGSTYHPLLPSGEAGLTAIVVCGGVTSSTV